jgi:type IV secretory pathway VirB6-like protein
VSVVYEGEDGDDLKKVRVKLKCSANCNLQIRNHKIYEIRKRPKTQEITRKVMLDTTKYSKLLNTESSTDDTFKYVFNKFLNGIDKTVFKLKNNNA